MNTDVIVEWHAKHFPHDKTRPEAVFRKLLEEVGELSEAMSEYKDWIVKGRKPGDLFGRIRTLELEFGDVLICLTVLANQHDINLHEAIELAHLKNQLKGKVWLIKKRQLSMS